MADKLDHMMQRIRSLAGAQSAGQLSDRQLLERFSAERDEAAFVALVQRHGAMVLNVCRRVLHNDSDAEDACQATFLVLARKARSIRKQESLGCWLHGVAHRAATSLLRQITRRRAHENQAATAEPARPADDVTWHEVRAILDDEIQRLPQKLKDPILLCYLQGKTHNEGASALGVNLTTFRGRLERARMLLQKKLTQRGVTLSAALLATVLFERVGTAALPATLVVATVKTAMAAITGQNAAGLISTQVLTLAEGVINTMFVAKLKITAAALVTLSIVVLSAGVFSYRAISGEQTPLKRSLNQATDELNSVVNADKQEKPTVPKKDDKDLILGTWRLVKLEVDGEARTPGTEEKWVIGKDKIEWKIRTRPVELTYSLAADKSPKAMDMAISAGTGTGLEYKGIYSLDGDTLKVCYQIGGDARPKAFQTGPGDSKGVLLVFKRLRDADPKRPPADQKVAPKKEGLFEKELKALEGRWEMLSMEFDGKKELLPAKSKLIMTHKGKTWIGTMNGKKVEEGTFAIDPTQKPKTMDIAETLGALKGTTRPAIYELNGDELRVCLVNNPLKRPELGRPTKFTSEPDSGYIIINYKRVADKPLPKDEELLQGAWKVKEADANGKHLPQEVSTDQIWTIANGKIAVRYDDGAKDEWTFKLDPSATPRAIDVKATAGLRAGYGAAGIYELKSDTLRVSLTWSQPARRPSTFALSEDRGGRFFVLERVPKRKAAQYQR